jgi:hypothetical protein
MNDHTRDGQIPAVYLFRQDHSVTGMLNDLVAWGQAQKNMRAERPKIETR